ncbi:MAG: hypothetical protein IE916_00215 [Epsilonproteobacteria bacterium]|nr:hypothetical protein [Campylobacterota bacterium]
MRKLLALNTLLLFLATSANALVCKPIVERLDKNAMTDTYKEIAYWAYKHKEKREYLNKTYALLAELRKRNETLKNELASKMTTLKSVPLTEAVSLEGDALDSSNKMEIFLLEQAIYKSIKKEVKETYNEN